ncbi:receptor expression-enhancing protein 2 [Caerostris darwini]|uniref:Receptor expression-enhancing protein n=1 Tax=Caerostris darwini TaxID=1538125 RepID=A0AAV4RIB3_9ARAC|nr:receptor expression-enhancing protein 2 [Caerostris darwini]
MISVLLSRLVLLVFGTLYPAYASYKTVKTKNVRDYVKWMMYWIVFALYTCIEIFTDIFIAFWCPFYYELKIIFVLWLICPATRGSTYIFKKIINPRLSKYETGIDAHIDSLWDHGYDIMRKIGAQGVDYVGHVVLDLLRKGQITAVNFLPKINDVAHNDPVIATSERNPVLQNNLDENALDDEDFDILMVETPELYNNPRAVSSSKRQLEESQSDSAQDSDNPQSEELKSIKKRPLRVTTRNKTKASGLRERKKKNAN